MSGKRRNFGGDKTAETEKTKIENTETERKDN